MAPNELVILRQIFFLNEQHSIFTRLPCLKWQMVQYAIAIAPYGLENGAHLAAVAKLLLQFIHFDLRQTGPNTQQYRCNNRFPGFSAQIGSFHTR